MPGERLAPAEGEATICGVFVETDPATGLAVRVSPCGKAAGWRLSAVTGAGGNRPAGGLLVYVFVAVALLLGLAGLATWQIPPRLDWARLRPRVAALASAELGRPVAIGGDVAITLLPQAVVVAKDVSLADRGDGISARIGALRLRVAFWPLLRGRVLPRELMLDRPAVTSRRGTARDRGRGHRRWLSRSCRAGSSVMSISAGSGSAADRWVRSAEMWPKTPIRGR